MKTSSKKPTSWRKLPIRLVILTVIVLLGLGMRLYQLGSLPATLNRDEAALAYNAFLLKETGQDEWGRSWPIALESFGDYKLPGYPLLLIPTFQLFGVSDFTARLPSALAGTGLIMLGYLFSTRVLRLKVTAALFVAFSVAVQPIFFFYSRMAWEANVALFLLLVAVVLFFTSSTKRRLQYDSLALLFSALAIATYNTPLLLLPFIAIAVMIDRGVKKYATWAVPVIGCGLIFIIGFSALASISQQKSSITLFNDETTWMRSVEHYQSFSGWKQTLLGNRYVFLSKEIFENLVASFSPTFMVTQGGGHPWHSIPGWGHVLIATYGLGVLGLGRAIFIVTRSTNKHLRIRYTVILFLTVCALAPAVITVDAPHATRSLFYFFSWTALSGLGMEWLYSIVDQPNQRQSTLKVFFVLTIVFGLTNELNKYYFAYYHNYPQQSAEILKAGLSQAVYKIEHRADGQDEQIAIVDPDGFSYVSVAWALKMPPDRFFSTINHHLPDRIGLKYGYRVGRYRFIADRDDRTAEDIHIIEWDPDTARWIIDLNL